MVERTAVDSNPQSITRVVGVFLPHSFFLLPKIVLHFG